MSKTFAAIQNGIVSNLMAADDLEVAQAVSNQECIEYTDHNSVGIGWTYDGVRDAFIAPKPYPSWTLVEATCQWESPYPMPNDGKMYSWNEATLSWVFQ